MKKVMQGWNVNVGDVLFYRLKLKTKKRIQSTWKFTFNVNRGLKLTVINSPHVVEFASYPVFQRRRSNRRLND